MRIVDLSTNIDDTVELLRGCAINQSGYRASCYDLTGDELLPIVSKLLELARLANTLAELAIDSLGDTL